MSKKLKIRLIRIIVVLLIFIPLFVLEKIGTIETLPGIVQFVLFFIPYLIIGYDVLIKAAKNISHGQVFDENFLMIVATFAAFGLGLLGEGEYPEALAVMLFYQVGELFQDYAVGKSRQSIAQMMDIVPEYANLEVDGSVEEVDPDDVELGSVIVIKPGERIPLDGVVIEGESFLDTAALTGESVPRRVAVGDDVISGCINGDSILRVETTKEFDDSTVSKILELVENASEKKAKLENFITRFAKYYTPIVTVGALILALCLPLVFKQSWAEGISRACNFLIVSCPCALVISVPLGFFGGIGAASRIGVLIKGSNYIEAISRMNTVVMDKTGTLTKGEFKVQSINPENGITEDVLIALAASGESYSTHPIALSILSAYGKEPDNSKLGDVKEIAGHGVETTFDGKQLLLGNEKLLKSNNIAYTSYDGLGTVIYVSYDGKYAGNIVIADGIKDGVKEAISEMKASGINKTVMLTGDRKKAADEVANLLGIDVVKSELLPADKVSQIEEVINDTKSNDSSANIGFVGDGINDAPVLMRADVGFAMGSLGSDAAIEAADVVIMDDDIRKIPMIKRIAKKTMSIVKSNVTLAIAVKILILILSIFGIANMWMAVFGDVGVCVICVINAMRTLKIKQ